MPLRVLLLTAVVPGHLLASHQVDGIGADDGPPTAVTNSAIYLRIFPSQVSPQPRNIKETQIRAATTTAPTMLNAFLMTLPSDLHDGIIYLKGNVRIEIGARPLDVLTIRSKEEYPGVILPI